MRIRTPSRIHISLIDLNGSLGRVDGGLGIALEEPHMELRVEPASRVKARGDLAGRAEQAARAFLEHYDIRGGADIEILQSYPQHVGLGSGTQLSLAVARMLARIYGVEAGLEELAYSVGRGGTSGIGTLSFRGGGFILDGGHSFGEKGSFLPSRASGAGPAPLLFRRDFSWPLALIFPRKEVRVSGRKEVDIFQEFCPIEGREVERLSRIILMQLLPSLVEGDVVTFGKALNFIQKVGFKAIELSLQPREVREVLERAQGASYGAGLSSFGPVIYSLVEERAKLEEAVGESAEKIIYTRANNMGARVYEDGQV